MLQYIHTFLTYQYNFIYLFIASCTGAMQHITCIFPNT